MHFGLTIFPTDYSIQPADLAMEAEARGFESLWLPEHTHIPTSRKSPWPGGAELPKYYYDTYDPFLSLAAAAAVTKKIKLATGICLVVERDPIHTAKEVSTIDRLSGGRFIFGIGAGWLREESDLLGVDFPRRWTQTAEYIAAMRELWSRDEASFDGNYVKFSPVRCNPKPIRQPGPPVLLGSLDKNVLKRVAKWADGWCPNRMPHDYVKSKVEELRRECDAIGRDFSQLEISPFGFVEGNRSAVHKGLEDYRKAGATRFVIGIRYQLTPDSYEAELTRLATLYL
jgi:probable F420-dependent oxidoreductase